MKLVFRLFFICFVILPATSWGTPVTTVRTPQQDANRIIASSFAGCGSIPSAPSDSVLTPRGLHSGTGTGGAIRSGGAAGIGH